MLCNLDFNLCVCYLNSDAGVQNTNIRKIWIILTSITSPLESPSKSPKKAQKKPKKNKGFSGFYGKKTEPDRTETGRFEPVPV
jgi:hypothetical protein